ncbi:MAG: ABC transporter ATP-binding protein [Maritimibacter sp.]
MASIVSVKNLTKTYEGGFQALKGVNLEIEEGEILALLGPNGAGKTTLISTICGLTNPTSGSVTVGGHDVVTQYKAARKLIGLVPQELSLQGFHQVGHELAYTRGLFGKKKDAAYLEQILRDLSLWDKKDNMIMTLSGGMKRRVLIGKALSHGPRILFLDEPTAGVDVELRKDMWAVMRKLSDQGVTIILTTHYIEEAEEMADRVGVINKGEILLLEDKTTLMERMGKKSLRITLDAAIEAIPAALAAYDLELAQDGTMLTYTYDTSAQSTGITGLLTDLKATGLHMADLDTTQSSLEEIFVGLVHEGEDAA